MDEEQHERSGVWKGGPSRRRRRRRNA